ncbi:MAG: hypothetical protein DWP97_12995 [Calditrichaeota bacterium]|nr:MAG: hypothetical protein DWP97_12995 [Calditrichota bacterium]
MVTKANIEKEGFFIEITCPGCGGNLELQDNFFAVECSHCSSRHRLVMPNSPPAFLTKAKVTTREARFAIDRYAKKHNLPLSSSDFQLKKVYYPYWKIDAVLFRYRKRVEKRVVMSDDYDTNSEISYDTEKTEISLSPYTTTLLAGVRFEGLPESIGLRSNYLKLNIFADHLVEDDFDSLPVAKSWETMRSSLMSHIGSIGSYDSNHFGANKTEVFCPKASLIYFPFMVFDFYDDDNFHRYVVDAVTGRILSNITELNITGEYPDQMPDIKFGEIKIEQHRCGNCGEDLPADESLVYICKNCQVLTDLEPGVAIDTISAVDIELNPDDIMVPFWSLKLHREDAKRIQPFFGGMFHSDHIVIPAFKVSNFDAMSKLAKRVSSAYPKFKFREISDMDNQFRNVNLPLTEAILLASLFIHKDKYVKGLGNKDTKSETFVPTEISLFYAPFHLESYFYVDSYLNAVTFEKKLV